MSIYAHTNWNWLSRHMHTVRGAGVLDTETKQKPLSKHNALCRLLTELNNHFWWFYIQINSTNTQWAPTVCPALCSSLEYKDKWVRVHRLLGEIDALKKTKKQKTKYNTAGCRRGRHTDRRELLLLPEETPPPWGLSCSLLYPPSLRTGPDNRCSINICFYRWAGG